MEIKQYLQMRKSDAICRYLIYQQDYNLLRKKKISKKDAVLELAQRYGVTTRTIYIALKNHKKYFVDVSAEKIEKVRESMNVKK